MSPAALDLVPEPQKKALAAIAREPAFRIQRSRWWQASGAKITEGTIFALAKKGWGSASAMGFILTPAGESLAGIVMRLELPNER